MKLRDLVEMVALAAVWGASFLFIRMASPVMGPMAVAACRVAVGALLLLPLVRWRGHLGLLPPRAGKLAVAALLACVIPFLSLSQAARTLPAGLMSILNATTPMWGALVGWLWMGESLQGRRLAGLLLGMAGVTLLSADKSQLAVAGALPAAGLALVATLSYALAVHYSKRHLSDLPALSNTAGTLGMAGLMLAGPAWALGPLPTEQAGLTIHDWADVPPETWAAVTALGAVCTGAAYLVFFRLIDSMGPSRALTVTFLIPIFGMLWGVLFLGERITPLMALSTAIIVAGTWLANHAPRARAAVAQQT